MRIVFVCTGNLCRSPMAEVMMIDALGRRACTGIEVSSVGTWAYEGHPAMAEAVETMRSMQIDLSEHRSHAVIDHEIEAADLVVVMTSVHVRELKKMAPGVTRKVVMLKELTEIEMADVPDAGREQRLAALLAGKRPEPRRSLDVDDPIGMPLSVYERTVGELIEGVDFLADLLC
jgi:protein-tyrosine phosphatase